MFGVVSWRCACLTVPKAHLRCTLSFVDSKRPRVPHPCPLCQADLTFGKDRVSDFRAVRLNVHDPPPAKESDDPPSDNDAESGGTVSIPSPTDDYRRDPNFGQTEETEEEHLHSDTEL